MYKAVRYHIRYKVFCHFIRYKVFALTSKEFVMDSPGFHNRSVFVIFTFDLGALFSNKSFLLIILFFLKHKEREKKEEIFSDSVNFL